MEDRPWSTTTSAERIAQFLRTCPPARVTIVVEAPTVEGLAWLAANTAGRELRLVLGSAFAESWETSPAGVHRETVAGLLARPDVETRFWQPRTRRHDDPSISVWYTDGPPPDALNATTQLTAACLHEHIDSIGSVQTSDLDYVRHWVQRTVDGSWDVTQTLHQAP